MSALLFLLLFALTALISARARTIIKHKGTNLPPHITRVKVTFPFWRSSATAFAAASSLTPILTNPRRGNLRSTV